MDQLHNSWVFIVRARIYFDTRGHLRSQWWGTATEVERLAQIIINEVLNLLVFSLSDIPRSIYHVGTWRPIRPRAHTIYSIHLGNGQLRRRRHHIHHCYDNFTGVRTALTSLIDIILIELVGGITMCIARKLRCSFQRRLVTPPSPWQRALCVARKHQALDALAPSINDESAPSPKWP